MMEWFSIGLSRNRSARWNCAAAPPIVKKFSRLSNSKEFLGTNCYPRFPSERRRVGWDGQGLRQLPKSFILQMGFAALERFQNVAHLPFSIITGVKGLLAFKMLIMYNPCCETKNNLRPL